MFVEVPVIVTNRDDVTDNVVLVRLAIVSYMYACELLSLRFCETKRNSFKLDAIQVVC